MRKRSFLAALAILCASSTAHAAQLKVCASGCTYTNAQLQTALNAAVGGDEVLLQEGYTYTGNFTLPKHTGATMVTLRTGVSATGSVLSTGGFPAANIRMTAALALSSNLAKFQSASNNLSALATANPSAGAGPAYWTVQWVEGLWNAGNTDPYVGSGSIFRCGDDDRTVVTVIAEIPHHITFNQVYVHGHTVRGQFRGIELHCSTQVLTNSTVVDIKSQSEGQAVWSNSFETSEVITNNYLSGGAETIMWGGGGGCCRVYGYTVASASSATAVVLSAFTDLHVGQGLTIQNASAVEEYTEIVSCGTSTANAACTSATMVLTSGAKGGLSTTPSAGAAVSFGLNYRDITVTKNYVTKPVSDRGPILGTPQSVTATAGTGGSLAAGVYAFRVVAKLPTNSNQTAQSAPSAEVSATTAASGTVTVTWAQVTNAVTFDIWGYQPGAENVKWTVTTSACASSVCSYQVTTTTGTAGTMPTSASVWQVKNIMEFKNGEDILVEGNIFDGVWVQAQTGYGWVFTIVNQSNQNDSTRIGNLTVRNNILRNAAGVMQISGRDVDSANNPSGRMHDVSITNNLAYNINTSWGGSARTLLMTTRSRFAAYQAAAELGPLNVTIAHNTLVQTSGNALMNLDLMKPDNSGTVLACENCLWNNNIGYKSSFGLNGGNSCSEGNGCWAAFTKGTSAWLKNIVADAACANYPGGCTQTFVPSATTLAAEFVDSAANDFALKATSVYHNAASDGADIGANIATITPLTNIALSGDNTGGTPAVPPSIATAALPNGQVSSVYSASLAGVCPTAPCVWASTGTLPTGLSLTSVNSTTATITGTAQVGGTSSFTVTLTDPASLVASVSYIVTIANAPVTATLSRASRDWLNEAAHFRRATDPCVAIAATDTDPAKPAEPCQVGDTWSDTSVTPPVLNFATSLSPTGIWTAISGVVPPQTLTFLAGASVTYTNVPGGGGEFPGANRNRIKPYLVGYTQCALTTYMTPAAISTTDMDIEYWDGAAWQKTGITIPLGTSSGFKEGAYQTLAVGARTDLATLRVFLDDGDGVVDPAFTNIHMTCK